MNQLDDPDDWFAQAAGEQGRSREEPAEDDWVRDTPVKRAPRTASLRAMPRNGQIALGAVALALLLLVLWAVGAFGGGGSAPRTPATTAAQPPQPTAPSSTPAAVPPPTTTLAPGNSGREVKRLQRALSQLGYSPGLIDGSYGPATESALARFQRANGLQPDGVLGPKTLSALNEKLAAG